MGRKRKPQYSSASSHSPDAAPVRCKRASCPFIASTDPKLSSTGGYCCSRCADDDGHGTECTNVVYVPRGSSAQSPTKRCAREGCHYKAHPTQGHGYCCDHCRKGKGHGYFCAREACESAKPSASSGAPGRAAKAVRKESSTTAKPSPRGSSRFCATSAKSCRI